MFSQKRTRDEFAVDYEPESQAEYERKKPRPLPFRTSPTTKHTTLFSQHHQFVPKTDHTLTPTESSDEDEDNGKPRKQKQPFRRPVQLPFLQQPAESQSGSTDCDMEMVDIEPQPPELQSPWSAGITNGGTLMPSPIPGHLINESLNISGGRTATPIYGHFTRNMDPNVMAHASSSSLAPPGGAVPSPLQSEAESDWWRRRRLPSPISEGEDSLASPADFMSRRLEEMYGGLQSKPDEYLTTPFADQNPIFHAQRPRPPAIITSNADGDGVGRGNFQSDMELSSPPSRRFPAPDNAIREGPPATPVQSRSRSNAFGSGSGGKVSFSMGYRADCDKCLRKVPGHYSHIIRS